jgi:hypothetical protein
VAISFPTSLDNFTNPSSGNTLDSPSHSLQHSDSNDAIEAIEAKLGIGASPAGSATSGQVLTASTGGTTTWSTPTVGGLVQIVPSSVAVGSGSGSANANGRVTFTGASSVSLNDVFTSTYNNYKILIRATSATSLVALSMRLRVSGTDNSSSNYTAQRLVIDGTTLTGQRPATTTEWGCGSMDSTVQNPVTIELFNPFETRNTVIVSDQCHTITGNIVKIIATGGTTVTTSYTGFTIFCAQNITGEISVYGYR